MKILTPVLVTLLSAPALAERISIADFSGPGAAGVRNQLVSAVCDTADCIAPAKATTKGKPDWKKAKKASVNFVVTGTVVKKGKAQSLELQVFDKNGSTSRKSYALEKNGTLSAKHLQSAIDQMQSAFGAGGSDTPAVPPPTTSTKPPPTGTGAATATATTTPPPPPPTKTEPTEPEPTPEPVKPAKKSSKKGGPMFLAVEAGVSLLSRKLDYVQAATPNLRRYELPFPFPQIDVRAEFYPLALVRDDALAGLGVDFAIGLAPYLKSRRQSSPESYPTSTTRITGGLRYRWMPFEKYAAAFIPMLGINVRSFTVGAASDGTTLDGLPNVSFVGLRAGLGLELPILTDFLYFFGRFTIIPCFSSGQLISSAYFPNGSTLGLDFNAGLGVKVLSFLSFRAAFEFEQYSSKFTTQPTDTYVAEGSIDRYMGVSLAARFEF
jgi:hypothetical protein